MPKTLMVVLSNPTSPEDGETFDTWYNETHLHDVAALPGVIAATRYAIFPDMPLTPGVAPAPHQSLAIYEIEGETVEDIERVQQALAAGLANGMVISPTFDFASVSGFFAKQVSERVTKQA